MAHSATPSSQPHLILASASPRRRDLLARAGFSFAVQPADVDETPPPGVQPDELALLLAYRKASHAAATNPHAVVLGVDTVVDDGGRVLGKPADEREAIAMLSALQGRRHAVHTGMFVVRPAGAFSLGRVVTAFVTMRQLSEQEIRAYAATGEPLDKAGSYGIQGQGGALISEVEGSRLAVVGLALDELLPLLDAAGLSTTPPEAPCRRP